MERSVRPHTLPLSSPGSACVNLWKTPAEAHLRSSPAVDAWQLDIPAPHAYNSPAKWELNQSRT